ncbi:MAG: DUF5131 family protein, partial [Alphaproteobacteria bacterium]
MSDLFHEAVPDEFIDAVYGHMALRPHLTFQVLTKRPDRMAAWYTGSHRLLETTEQAVNGAAAHIGRSVVGPHFVWDGRGSDPWRYPGSSDPEGRAERIRQRRTWPGWPLPNVWAGCTVEDQQR